MKLWGSESCPAGDHSCHSAATAPSPGQQGQT